MRCFPLLAVLTSVALLGPLAAAENVVLISVTALRADHLGCYGAAARTPGADRWAAQGVLLERAYSQSPLTLPANATLMTGTHPPYHGVRDDFGFRLPSEQITLAEVLGEAGFETAAFISSTLLEARFGLDQGFALYDQGPPEEPDLFLPLPRVRPAAETTGLAIEWLRQRGGQPFFLWLQLADTGLNTAADQAEAVTAIDGQLARLDDFLRQANLAETTHILLVSDFGVGQGEHGETTPGLFLYDSTLHVPWIIRPAASTRVRNRRITTAFSHVDVAPTILQLLGQPLPGQFQGESALAEIQGGPAPAPRPQYSETYLPYLRFGWSRLKSIRIGSLKLIDAPTPELYDLEQDPGETRNLAGQDPARTAELRQQLLSLQARYQSLGAAAAIVSLPGPAATRLAGEGGASGVVIDRAPEGADPKGRIDTFQRFQEIVRQLRQPNPATLERIRRLREVEPQLPGLDYLEGVCLEKLGDLERARTAYLKEIETHPENHAASLNLASIHLRLKEPAAAHVLYQQVVEADPGNFLARNQLGLLWRARGFIEQAAEELQVVTSQAPAYVPGWINYGSTLALLGRLEEAEQAFRKAISVNPSFAEAHFHLSQVLEATNRKQEAILERELAARLDPRFKP